MVNKTSGSRRTSRPPKTTPAQQALVGALPLPAALLDRQGRIRALNAAWSDAARPGAMMAPDDHPGSDHLHALRDGKGFHQKEARALSEALAPVVAGEAPRAEAHYRIGEGDEAQRWHVWATQLELDALDCTLVVHQEATEDLEQSEASQRMSDLMVEKERQSAVARDRGRLLDAAEQSFHAPITPIRLQLHLLRNGALGDLNPRQSAAIERIERNVRRWWSLQEHLVSDLHALESKSEAVEPTDAGELFDEAVHPFQDRALQAGIRLRIDRSDDEMPITVERRAMVQVLMYTMDHAIRTTPAGGLVWVHLRPTEGRAEWVVQDQDPDMDPAMAAELIKSESTMESELRSGLLHAHGVLERNGGGILTDCHGPGRGLEVTFHVPLARASSGIRGALAPEEATHHA